MMRRQQLMNDCRGAVSVLFATAAVPIVGLLGLAVDYSLYAQASTQMQLAADGAAINATRLAASEYVVSPTGNWQTDAPANGNEWFLMQLSSLREASATSHSVSVARNGTAFTSTVTYQGTVPTHFARMFGKSAFVINGGAGATITINAYVNVTLLLDNSSSMLIGSTTDDINTLQAITACSPESMTSNQGLGAWSGPTPSSCPSSYVQTTNVSYNVNPPTAGQTPNAAPCGFACHWSNNNQKLPNGSADYTQYDYYNLARFPAHGAVKGYSAPQLRFDVVQSAASNVIQTMAADEAFAGQFGVAIYTFGSGAHLLTKYYPSSGEAGTDLSTDSAGAQTAAAGITTPVVANDGDTDFPDALVSLYTNNLTAAGDGSSAASPKKALFVVTDGILDYTPTGGSRSLGPFNNTATVNACNHVKAMGINLYVLYTPYTPLPYNPFYVSNIAQYVNNPPTPNDIIQALQACASSPSNYYEADIPSQITTGLNVLLQAAISSPARINS